MAIVLQTSALEAARNAVCDPLSDVSSCIEKGGSPMLFGNCAFYCWSPPNAQLGRSPAVQPPWLPNRTG